ncbi:MAG: hypothetical protein K2H46_12420 [Muribaculaceae bacterium]|nr:hypothetical protein [Muribaculaceae bacterium]
MGNIVEWIQRNWHAFVWGFALLCMLGLIIDCGYVSYKSIGEFDEHKKSDKELIELLKSLETSDFNPDFDLKFLNQNDREKVIEAQKLLLARQEMLVDDYRQETNNLINKMNGWLAFWIGIIALLGVIVPLAWQIRVARETRDLELDLRNRINDNLNRVEDIEFMTWVRIFNTIFDVLEARDTAVRVNISEFVWANIREGIDRYIRLYINSNGLDRNTALRLSVALIMLSSNLSALRQQSQRRIRNINNASDLIRNIVVSLNSPHEGVNDIANRLNILTTTLQTITIR